VSVKTAQRTYETLSPDEDNGTMPECLDELRDLVIGHRIVKVESGHRFKYWLYATPTNAVKVTLDTGATFLIAGGDDCCAYTELESFIFNADKIDHVITEVSTENQYTVWHVAADAGDVLKMNVGWSSGNPFYYSYGFTFPVVSDPGEDGVYFVKG
jgi:hypothetical protein